MSDGPVRPSLEVLVESVLFVAPEPVELGRLEQLLGVERAELVVALTRLAETLESRGVRLQRHGERAQLVSAPECAPAVERFFGAQSKSKLSPAALETLAIIAYRQPATRAQIEALRGVNCERALATLLTRNLIAEVGRQESVGRPILFGTTIEFLEYFGLASLADLPPLGEGEATLGYERAPRTHEQVSNR